MDDQQELMAANRTLKQRRAKQREITSISGEIGRFLKLAATPAAQNTSVPSAFETAAGGGLARQCKIESIQKGIVKISAPAGATGYELQNRLPDILEFIKNQCPKAKIREIKIIYK